MKKFVQRYYYYEFPADFYMVNDETQTTGNRNRRNSLDFTREGPKLLETETVNEADFF